VNGGADLHSGTLRERYFIHQLLKFRALLALLPSPAGSEMMQPPVKLEAPFRTGFAGLDTEFNFNPCAHIGV